MMSIRQTAGPVPLRRAVAELLAALPDPLAELKYRRLLCLEAYDAGYELGVEDGRRQALGEEADWRRGTAALTRDALAGRPFADLELLRWGPRGREHFADPRPDDFPGRGAA
jgi:hypothetical protein